MFGELGAAIVDADQLARDVVEPGSSGLAEISERFGPEVLTADGRLDRPKMGEIIFSDPEARRLLNTIVHPRVAEASREAIAAHANAGESVVIYEAALLVENGIHRGLDGLIVVAAPEVAQLERIRQRDGLAEAAARARIRAQLPLEDKIAAADYVIDNGGTLDETRAQVKKVWELARERST